jgi:hypothetical protein
MYRTTQKEKQQLKYVQNLRAVYLFPSSDYNWFIMQKKKKGVHKYFCRSLATFSFCKVTTKLVIVNNIYL